MVEVVPVLRPHLVRWMLPDDPGPQGLCLVRSYLDRFAYVETDSSGAVAAVEHHRTLGDWVRAVVGAGLTLLDVVELVWPAGHERVWGTGGRNAGAWSLAPRSW